jgi:hypothetical protein
MEAGGYMRPVNAGMTWDIDDDLSLLSQKEAGWSITKMALVHGRTEGAITFRLDALDDPSHYAARRLAMRQKESRCDTLCNALQQVTIREENQNKSDEVQRYTEKHCGGGKRLYVLALEEGKYYVGTTRKTAQQRMSEHLNGGGTAWTERYKPVKIILEEAPYRPYSEDATTLLWMAVFGVDAVRGGQYSSLQLTEVQLMAIQHAITHDEDRCFSCGSKDHFALHCTSSSASSLTDKLEESIDESTASCTLI